MQSIEIDFDVYKELTMKRENESVSYNDVIRSLLGLDPSHNNSNLDGTYDSSEDWVTKGIRFPKGTEFRANLNGRAYTGKVEKGALCVDGKRHTSPSSAAAGLAGYAVNGWRFWEVKLPGKSSWQVMDRFRN